MRIQVRLAEPFWRAVGQRNLEIDLPTGACLGDLLDKLTESYPDLKKEMEEAEPTVFIGDDEATEETLLEDGQRVIWYGLSPEDNVAFTVKTAIINLSTNDIQITETPPELVEAYLGGRGLNMAYLRHYLSLNGGPKEVDPSARITRLLSAPACSPEPSPPTPPASTSPPVPPESGILGDSNCGGFFAAAMRKAGFDRLVILGQSETPCYILLEAGEIKIMDAGEVWGTRVIEAQAKLKALHGPGTVSAVISPAGENLTRMACIMTGKKNAAGRGGMGAVMGSKKLKAIVARGGKKIEVAQKDTPSHPSS